MSKTKKLLSEDARAELLAAYKADKKTDAPANISDKTLITHYGNETQKKMLEVAGGGTQTPPADQTQKGAAGQADGTTPDPVKDADKGLQKPQSGKDAAYVTAVNEFVALNGGKMPESGLTTEQVVALNNATKEANNAAQIAAQAAAENPTQNTTAQPASRHGKTLQIVNKETGDKTSVSEHTFNNFIAKTQPEWQIAGEVPQEVKNLQK